MGTLKEDSAKKDETMLSKGHKGLSFETHNEWGISFYIILFIFYYLKGIVFVFNWFPN